MHISDYLAPASIKIPLNSTTKEAAIRELAHVLAARAELADPEALIVKLLERERIVPQGTFMMEFAAFPHSAGHFNGTHVAIGKPKTPIDWEHADGISTPVEFIAMVIADRKEAVYIPLGQLSEILKSSRMRDEIRAANTPEELLACLSQESEAIAELQELPARGVHLIGTLK